MVDQSVHGPAVLTVDRITRDYELTIRHESSTLGELFALSGELDGASAKTLESMVLEIEQGDATRITLDLGELSFIDSTGLAVLLRAVERSRHNGHRVAALRSRDAHVQRLFRVTAVDELIPFID